jgi:hypothetical protein
MGGRVWKRLKGALGVLGGLTALMGGSTIAAPTADEAGFRALYKELVEINTTRSVGSCTQAAEAVRARLVAGGVPVSDTQILAPPDRPKDGALIAVIHGTDKRIKPILPAAMPPMRCRNMPGPTSIAEFFPGCPSPMCKEKS